MHDSKSLRIAVMICVTFG